MSRGGGATEARHEGPYGFWILIFRGQWGSHHRLQSDGSEISAEQTRGQGRGECGLVRCGWWEWHAVLLPERVVGSWVSMAPPRNFWVCPQLPSPRWWRLSRGWSLKAWWGWEEEDPERKRPLCSTPRPSSAELSGDPHLRAGRQPGGPGRAHGGSSDSPPPTHSPRACSALWVLGWRPCQSSGISLSAHGDGVSLSLD